VSRKIIYSGKLAIPAAAAPTGLLGEHTRLKTILDHESGGSGYDRAECVVLLMGHYHVDPRDKDAWQSLAMALAKDHVPAFRPRRSGRPKTKSSAQKVVDRESQLLRVEEMQHKNPALSELEACRRLLAEMQRSDARRKLGTVRADVALAKKERHTKLLVAALLGEDPFGHFFGLGTSGNTTNARSRGPVDRKP
jgi:hypothetical protein